MRAMSIKHEKHHYQNVKYGEQFRAFHQQIRTLVNIVTYIIISNITFSKCFSCIFFTWICVGT